MIDCGAMIRRYRLSRYIFMECAISSALVLFVLTFLIMLPRVLNLVDLWVNKGVAIGVLGDMIFWLMPQFVVSVAPMALLIGILLALGRFSQDSETVVLKASGVSLYQILFPIAILVSLFTILTIILNMTWVPGSFHQFAVLRNALLSSTTLALKPQTFNQTIPGLTIYIHEKSENGGLLNGVLIHDERKPHETVTLTARSGQLQIRDAEESVLFLEEGSRHEKLPEGRYRQLRFSSYTLDLGVSLGLKEESRKSGHKEMGLGELIHSIRFDMPDESLKAAAEFHRRLAFPFAGFILGIFSVSLGLQQSHRTGRAYGFIVAVIMLLVHFMLLSFGEAAVHRGLVLPGAGYWIPNLMMALLTVYVTIHTARDGSFRILVWLAQFLSSLPQMVLRVQRAPKEV
ncbi:MAG: LPS export ABC transporter permease LptF [Magnetococcales bacterium]|nr:LPS export ABC transporter permease LptF [Magnetococcales bacterium]